MAGWTNPITWAAGNTVTAAQMNTYVRDNQNAQITIARLISTSGGTFASGTGGQNIGRSAVLVDPRTMATAGGLMEFTVPISGTYRVKGRVGGSSTAIASLSLYKGGVSQYAGLSGTGNLELAENDVALVAGDVIALRLNTSSSTYVLAAGYLGTLTGDFTARWVSL